LPIYRPAALPQLGAARTRRGSRRVPDGARRRARRALQRRAARLPQLGSLTHTGGSPVRRRCPTVSVFLVAAALVLAPWTAWLASSLPCRYLSQHWNVAWAGFDTALAATLALTGVAALHHAPWLDRAAV